jgi:hypothetical protein
MELSMKGVVNSNTFEEWFKHSTRESSVNWPPTCCLPEERAREIAALFNHFMKNPNDLYYDYKTQKVYPIGSKSRTFSSIDEVKEKISLYREKYDKLILYSIQLETETEPVTHQFYKVRWAVFPEQNRMHSPEAGMSVYHHCQIYN